MASSPYDTSRKRGDRSRRNVFQQSGMEKPMYLVAFQLIVTLVMAGIVAVITRSCISWVQQRFQPFCDNNVASDDCTPCPYNGICERGKLECLAGFTRNGMQCVEDKLIDKKAEKLARIIEDHVCKVNGQSICNGAGDVWLYEKEVMNAVQPESSRGLAEERALAICSRKLQSRQFYGMQEFCCPRHRVQKFKPFSCRLNEWISSNLLKLCLTFALLCLVGSVALRYERTRRVKVKAENLYVQICQALELKSLGEGSPSKETWIVASRLRDHLLTPRERQEGRIWMEVERLVREDSRIEIYPKLVKGESKIVWEWQIEGNASPAIPTTSTTALGTEDR